LAEFDGVCSVDQYVYKVDPSRADAAFIALYMRSPQYLARAPIGITPGQLPRIRTQEVAQVSFELPPLPVQRSIAAKLRTEIAAAAELRTALEAKLATLDRLPAALLRQVFGEGDGKGTT
jgi:type I restriction enzyme S subunit